MKKKILILGAMAIATASFTLYSSSVSQTKNAASLVLKNVEALADNTEKTDIRYGYREGSKGFSVGNEVRNIPCCLGGYDQNESCDFEKTGCLEF